MLYFTDKIPHSYSQGTDIFPHVHFITSDSKVGVVRWGLEYTWVNVGNVFPNSTKIYCNQTTSGATPNQHYLTFFNLDSHNNPINGISGTGKLIKGQIIGRIFRDSDSSIDTYTSKVGLIELSFNYEKYGIGSQTQTTKSP